MSSIENLYEMKRWAAALVPLEMEICENSNKKFFGEWGGGEEEGGLVRDKPRIV